jgi:hypothetical protein
VIQQLEELTKNLEGVNIWVKPGKMKRLREVIQHLEEFIKNLKVRKQLERVGQEQLGRFGNKYWKS